MRRDIHCIYFVSSEWTREEKEKRTIGSFKQSNDSSRELLALSRSSLKVSETHG